MERWPPLVWSPGSETPGRTAARPHNESRLAVPPEPKTHPP